jgi:glutaconate CoA-transferase, subunit A
VAEFLALREAIDRYVQSGDMVAMEGFTHLIPFAAAHEIIRQRKRELWLVRMTPDLIYDQLIGAGCARKLTFSWGGNPGVGSLHRFRDAVEHQWPMPLEIVEHSHAAMAAAYAAGASNLPFAVLRGYIGSDLPRYNHDIASIECPFTRERLAAVPALRPDVAIVHAQQANRAGDVLVHGIVGIQKEAILAAKRAIVTVEEIVDEFSPVPNAIVVPNWVVAAVCAVPGGAKPSYAHGYYARDNAFYIEWDTIARDRERFSTWIETNVMKMPAHV